MVKLLGPRVQGSIHQAIASPHTRVQGAIHQAIALKQQDGPLKQQDGPLTHQDGLLKQQNDPPKKQEEWSSKMTWYRGQQVISTLWSMGLSFDWS